MAQFSLFTTLLISFFVQALPGLLLGVAVSSGLLVFVDRQWWLSRLPRNRILLAIVGSSLGMILPVGQYGSIPVTRRFLGQGVPLPLAVSYLVASPTLNPLTLWISLQAFANYPKITFIRIVFVWLLGVGIGLLFSFASDEIPLFSPSKSVAELSPLLMTGTAIAPTEENRYPLQRSGNLIYEYAPVLPQSWRQRWLLFGNNMGREILELGSILLAFSAIAAGVQLVFPVAYLLHTTQSPLAQVLAMFGLGILFSAGAIASTLFASLLLSNFLNGSILALLLSSSFLNLQSMGLLLGTFRPKFALYLLILFALSTFVLTLGLNFYAS